MKKPIIKLFAMLLATLLLLSTFACGGDQKIEAPAPNNQQAQASTEPTTEPAAVPTPGTTLEPTIAPTLEPSATMPPDEWFIEHALSLLSRVAAVHGMELDRATAIVRNPYPDSAPYIEVECRESAGGAGFLVVLFRDGSGGYSLQPDAGTVKIVNADENPYSEEYLRELANDYLGGGLTVTPEEVLASGCTATDGDEFLSAVGMLMQEKLAERFLTAPGDSPIGLYEIRCYGCSRDNAVDGRYWMGFAVRAKDVSGLANFVTDNYVVIDYEDDVGCFGWILFQGSVDIAENPDGSMTCGDFCINMPG